jgi:hypothetical protein
MSTRKAKLGGDHGNQYKKVAGLSKNDKPGNPPHNTQKIIAESLGNKQDLLEIGLQKKSIAGGDKKSAAAKSGLSKNDKPGNPPHNTQKIIAESLGNKQDLLEIGKAKREANLLIGKYKKEPDLSFNNKSEQPHNTREIIASNDQA